MFKLVYGWLRIYLCVIMSFGAVQKQKHRTKYQESGNLNIAETRGTIAETQRLTRVSVSGYITVSHVSVAAFSMEPEHFLSRFRQISVSGITYFRNRYHVNKLRKHEITFRNKFLSFPLSAEMWSYGPAMCLFFSVSVRFRYVNYVNVSKELFAHADANFSCR